MVLAMQACSIQSLAHFRKPRVGAKEIALQLRACATLKDWVQFMHVVQYIHACRTLIRKLLLKLGVIGYVCSPNTEKVETGRSLELTGQTP